MNATPDSTILRRKNTEKNARGSISALSRRQSQTNIRQKSQSGKAAELEQIPKIPEIVETMHESNGVPKAPGTLEANKSQKENPAADNPTPQSWIGWLGTKPDLPVKMDDTQIVAPATPTALTASKQNESASRPQESTTSLTFESNVPESARKRSWLQFWGDGEPVKASNASIASAPLLDTKTTSLEPNGSLNPDVSKIQKAAASEASSVETSAPPKLPGNASKSAGWVFWSNERRSNDDAASTSDKAHVGEIAVSDTPSQKRPKRASISVVKESSHARSQSEDTRLRSSKELVSDTDNSKWPQNPQPLSASKEDQKTTTLKVTDPETVAKPTKPSPNLLLPSFKDTLRAAETPGLLQQLSRLLIYTQPQPAPPKYLSITPSPPRIRNAIAVGVHGFFPAPLIRSFLGQPTGTSIKFADMAAEAIRVWHKRTFPLAREDECEVKTAALEGEGKIADRVDTLWKLLLNWIDDLRSADFILVACHSQGVPVATMLVAKLISFGCINPTKCRVGICAMAGVSMGPFSEYKTRWMGASAGELFEFTDASSKVSQDYLSALGEVLTFGVKINYVGSIDDQLVSLESAIFSPITHPNIFRTVFIDGRIHTSNFLSHLVGFVLKLRNLGVEDHGLIRELSTPLAGSLYGGEGHSRIYEDIAVYDTAVRFALETESSIPVELKSSRPKGGQESNPFILPFAMRGILEEKIVKSDLRDEVNDLLRQFDDWKPQNKALKDVKFRLEGIRSKL